MQKHAIVVGGTGMLRDVSLWLAEQDCHVTVIARNRQRLAALRDASARPERFTLCAVDYRDSENLRRHLESAQEASGPVQLVVAWIHSTAPQALDVLTEAVSRHAADPWRLFHVRGSAAHRSPNPAVPPNCRYHRIVLGFAIEGSRSRWLTHKEISRGVIQAIRESRPAFVVGTVEPWEMRPGWP